MKLVPPHGGKLKPLLLDEKQLKTEKERAGALPEVRMNSRETSDLIMMAIGAFSPLEGFMKKNDYFGVIKGMHMEDGTLWPIPITLSVTKEMAENIASGSEIALIDDESGELMGSMTVEEKFSYDKRNEAKLVFKSEDKAHPGVAKIYAQGDVYLAGPVRVFSFELLFI